jgi:hypothetical protein
LLTVSKVVVLGGLNTYNGNITQEDAEGTYEDLDNSYSD